MGAFAPKDYFCLLQTILMKLLTNLLWVILGHDHRHGECNLFVCFLLSAINKNESNYVG